MIDALTGLHRRASMGELEGDYGKKRVDAAVAGSTMMEQLGVSRSG